MGNFWLNIVQWFQNRSDRNGLVLGFNRSARDAFIKGQAPFMMEASNSRGDSRWKHQYSNFFYSGFRIKTFTGRQCTKEEIKMIGETILADEVLIRKLVVLGWDTLEIHCDQGNYGLKWQLCDRMVLGSGI